MSDWSDHSAMRGLLKTHDQWSLALILCSTFSQSADMALELVELKSDREFTPLMATLYEAYSHPCNGFWDMFKGTSGEECTTRFTQWHNSDPTSRWIYVKDTESGEIIVGAQWNIHEKDPFEKPLPRLDAYWIDEGQQEILYPIST